MTPQPQPRILLVHGAWVGAWEFEPLAPLLRERGWQVDAVELPSTGSTAEMMADATAVLAAIDAKPGPVVIVAHSYGGVPATQVGAHPNVERIVYVAAFALDEGESLLSSLGGSLPEFWAIADGQVSLGPNREARVAMVAADLPSDAPAGTAEAVADLFRPQSLASFSGEVSEAGWRVKPTTYVLTELDVLVPPAFQEMLASRAGANIVRVAHGHAPFQEDPVAFAELLERIVAAPLAA